ncbi:MAG: hypothetical protein EBQ92_09620 [Proteobacteria bacterium]|nr:hypothetical protein [Pseudomonadota bacterium]
MKLWYVTSITALSIISSLVWGKSSSNQAQEPAQKEILRPVVQVETGNSVGSGFFINMDGTVVTAEHVVTNSSNLRVKLFNGQYSKATILAVNKERDLAILKTELLNTPFISLGDEKQIKAGDKVSLLGSPVGLNHSVIQASVAAPKREVEKQSLIQLDGNVNQGLSGGPVTNSKNEVIGIVTMKAEKAQGIGFAIPVSELSKFLLTSNQSFSSSKDGNKTQFQTRNSNLLPSSTLTSSRLPVVILGSSFLLLLSAFFVWRAVKVQRMKRVPSNVTKLPIKKETYEDIEIELKKEVKR